MVALVIERSWKGPLFFAGPQRRPGYALTARHSHQASTTNTTQGSRDRNTSSTNSTTAAETAVRRTIAFD
jgi:hypothetical protein